MRWQERAGSSSGNATHQELLQDYVPYSQPTFARRPRQTSECPKLLRNGDWIYIVFFPPLGFVSSSMESTVVE